MGAHFAGGFSSGYTDTMRQLLPIVEQGKRHREALEIRKKSADIELKFLNMKTEEFERDVKRRASLQEMMLKGTVDQPTESAPEFGMATGQAVPPPTQRLATTQDFMSVMSPDGIEKALLARMTQAPKYMKGPNDALYELPNAPGGTPRVAVPGAPAGKGPKFMSGPDGAIIELPAEAGGTPRVALPGTPKDKEPMSPEGKKIADAERMFGKGSPQHKAMVEAFTAQAGGAEPPKLTDVAGLRKEFTARSANFLTIRDSYSRVMASAPTAAGDLSMIFNYMKMLDPGSVIRESEFAQAASSGSFGERIQGLVQRALDGRRLAAPVRADFIAQAGALIGSELGRHAQMEEQYRRQASLIRVDPRQVVVDFVGDLRPKAIDVPLTPTTAAPTFRFDPKGKRLIPVQP